MKQIIKFLESLRDRFILFTGNFKKSTYPMWLYYSPIGYVVKAKEMREVVAKLQKGDIILRGYDDYIDSRYFIGKWSHMGIALDGTTVLHAIAGQGVTTIDILDFMRTDRLAILRPKLTDTQIDSAITIAMSRLGMPYDYAFNFTNFKAFSCSELVYFCFKAFEKELGMFEPMERWLFRKQIIIRPAAFFEYSGLKQIYNTDEVQNGSN